MTELLNGTIWCDNILLETLPLVKDDKYIKTALELRNVGCLKVCTESNNDVILRQCYDIDNNITFYDVYDTPYRFEEELMGNYLGEFVTDYNLEDDEDSFKNDLDKWLQEL